MSDRRVVVTGLGAVTPVGNTATETWSSLVAGRSGIDCVTQFDASDYPVRIGGEVKDFDASGVVERRDLRNMSRPTQFTMVAADEAVKQAGLDMSTEDPERIGVIVGSGAGGIDLLLQQNDLLKMRGPRRLSPFFMPNFIVDATTGHLGIHYGIQGPNMAIVSACATGGHAVGEAYEFIKRDDADVMLAGGTEQSIIPIMFAGFISMRALADDNDAPEKASRPFDLTRHGFVLSEGSAMLVLEELEHARKRGVAPLAEVIGSANGNDAFHMANQPEGGIGASRMMRRALKKAGLLPEDVDYINAHGTSTPVNDKAETAAIKDVFGEHARKLAVSSTKSMLGHMMGAAGAIEALVCVRTIRDGCIPPTINYENPDPACDLDYVPNTARKSDVRVAISNSLGLGGHNSCLVFGKPE